MNFMKKNSAKSEKYYGKKTKKAEKVDLSKTILKEDAPFFVKEAYKALRTNIIFSLPTSECKKIAITSALAGEGKSTNSLNLAISFGQMGAKTVLIDADLRRPNISKLLEQKASPGLSNVLVGLSELKDVVKKTKFENLDVIFAGDIPPNPTELLISGKMSEFIDELAKDYEYIFIDCPPVNVVTDATIISKYVSGMILVVRQGETAKDEVIEAKKQFEFAGAKLIGTILNDAGDINSRYGYSKGKGKYKYKYRYRIKDYKYKAHYQMEYAEKPDEKK